MVALDGDGARWRAEVASPNGGATVESRHVVLATGGYVTPREHSAVDGPRPSGVVTADFVVDALDRGWRPARRAIVVGDGRIATGVRARLRTAGVTVETIGGAASLDGRAVTALRGQPRLEAVEIDGAWHPADTLIFADRLQAANFLLRGLGLGDERPGVPAPVDAIGRVAAAGAVGGRDVCRARCRPLAVPRGWHGGRRGPRRFPRADVCGVDRDRRLSGRTR